jgi:hypothetical protein
MSESFNSNLSDEFFIAAVKVIGMAGQPEKRPLERRMVPHPLRPHDAHRKVEID